MRRLPALLLTVALFSATAPAATLYWGGGTATIPDGTALPTSIAQGQ